MPDRSEEIRARINRAIVDRDSDDLDRLLAELYQKSKSADAPFKPAIELKPAARRRTVEVEGDFAINWANEISRAKRRIQYDIKTGSGFGGLRIVSEGDSWFQYPLLLRDIIDWLMDDDDMAVLSLDAAGDVVQKMASDEEYMAALDETRAHAFLLSAGGNDLLGDGAFSSVLKRYHSGAKADDLLNAGKLAARLDAIMTDYRKILSAVSRAHPTVMMFSHGYDIVHPRNGGKWLGGPLEKMDIPLKIGREVVGLVVDRFNQALADLRQEFPTYRHVDLRHIVDAGPATWHDELHPKDQGYERAAEAFRQAIKDHVKPVVERTMVRVEKAETFFCQAADGTSGAGLEMTLEAALAKPTVDRVVTTPHRSSRNGTRIDRIVIHYTTSRNINGTISWFKDPVSKVSAHYIVGRDGELVQVVADNERAWHAGNSAMNARSIGIEHVAADGDEITEKQAAKSAELIEWLMAEYGMAKTGVIPHCCVKTTSCCGDLFKAFGGGRNKKCDEQRNAIHAWMSSRGIPTTAGPASPGVEMAAGVDEGLEVDRSVRGDRIVEEADAATCFETGPAVSTGVLASSRASPTALRIAATIMEIRHAEKELNVNDIDEFSNVDIGNGLEIERLGDNLEMAAAAIDSMFGALEIATFDYLAFQSYIVDTLRIRHFKPVEFLFLGASNESGPCKGLNKLPEKSLWPNLGKTARMLDRIRTELGAPIKILSAYRNQAYNACISGAGGSFHKRFNAIDWRCTKGTVNEWRGVARRVRDSGPEFKGGIGFYPSQKFIHIDTRGTIADW